MKEVTTIAMRYDPMSSAYGTHNYIVEDEGSGALYVFFANYNLQKLQYVKSDDAGYSWDTPVDVVTVGSSKSICSIAVWYAGWSGVGTKSKIDIAWYDNDSHNVSHIQLDTTDDSLSSVTTVYNGTSISTTAGCLSIARSREDYLFVLYDIDGGTEHGFASSSDDGANWSSLTSATEGSTDTFILLPSWNDDGNDMMCIFWDSSASEISRKLYDNSADLWDETSIKTGVVNLNRASGIGNFFAVVDLDNLQAILVFHGGAGNGGYDLNVYTITESSITAKGNLHTSTASNLQLFPAVMLTNGLLYGLYWGYYNSTTGDSQGVLRIVNKTSNDSGGTWSNADTNLCITRVSAIRMAYYCPVSKQGRIHVAVCAYTPSSNHGNLVFLRDIKTVRTLTKRR